MEVNKTDKLNVSIGAVFKANPCVPHVNESADDPFGFAVCFRTIDASKLLTDTTMPASFDERLIVSPLKFLAIIGISVVDLVRTLSSST